MKGMNIKDLEGLGYKECTKIDLVKNKKEALLVNIYGIIIMVVMAVFIPLLIMGGIIEFNLETTFPLFFIVLLISLILYIPLHEIVHGIVLKKYTDEKLSFGWKLVYAYCGSKEAVVDRKEYYAVALAPLLVFSVVFISLMVLNPSLSLVWYVMEIMNVSGSVGDIYVSIKLRKEKSRDILITDSGTDMSFWSH